MRILSRRGFSFFLVFSLLYTLFPSKAISLNSPESSKEEGKEKIVDDSWMGIYINGVKVGFSHTKRVEFEKKGKKYKETFNETSIRVSRLGSKAVEMKTEQRSLFDASGDPLETILKTRLSNEETVIKAVILPRTVRFEVGNNVVRELDFTEKFYLEIPLKNMIEEGKAKSSLRQKFKILVPFSFSLEEAVVEILGKEDTLILGEKRELWHLRTEMSSLFPLIMDEWIDEEGISWKSVTQTGLMSTTSFRMPKERALEASAWTFDIALSTLIESNIKFDDPQRTKSIIFKLRGIQEESVKKFPWDDGSQRVLELNKDYVLIQTRAQIFSENEAIPYPVEEEGLKEFLKPTFLCQIDDPELKSIARKLTGEEKNSWRAAKKIAEWVSKEVRPSYDIGFASAKEVLKRREGDCSEYTVLTVALCRAVGIPARAALGIMYAYGIFAYHMWAEVYVGRWVNLDSKWIAIDSKSGEFFTDATHLKFGRSLLDENIYQEMAKAVSELLGKLRLEVLDYSYDDNFDEF